MFLDDSPAPNDQTDSVLVIEDGDHDIEEILEMAASASFEDDDGDTIYMVVFAEEPGRVWDMTERVLRDEIRKRASTAVGK